MWAFPIKCKDQVLDTFEKFHVDVGRETNKLLKCIRVDNIEEYYSRDFEEYCSKYGIKHEKIVPRTPQPNGIVDNEYENNGKGEMYSFKI